MRRPVHLVASSRAAVLRCRGLELVGGADWRPAPGYDVTIHPALVTCAACRRGYQRDLTARPARRAREAR